MISAFIFFAHFIFMLIIFTKKWQDEKLSTGLINIALIIILFSVGWSLTSWITQMIFDEKGLGVFFDRDTIALTILVIPEYFFYRIFYGKEKSIEYETEKQ
ncbi:MAG: hypothetical protein JXA68_05950 [Ignavibacteriales bacterium]|nr:hypothetical protein [Ignavibacteriales bacterium]